MRYLLLTLFALMAMVFTYCGDSEPATEELEAKGGKLYGGEFTFMTHERINVLIPAYVGDIYNSRVTSQIYDPLMVYDPNTETVVPAVAESFKKSSDSKVYTFKIRKGIEFHEDDCFGKDSRKLTAEDVKYTLDMACSGLEKNQVGHIFKLRIVGAKEFYEQTKGKKTMPASGVSGIKVIDDQTLQITLLNPSPGFEVILTNPSLGIVSKKAFEHYKGKIDKHAVGSGPFMLDEMTADQVTLKRNPNYWKKDEFGNQLPFLGRIAVKYAKNKKSELLSFRKAEADLVLEIPVENIENILGSLKEAQEGKNIKHKVDGEASMSMAYVAMAHESDEFSDVRVRQAFNLAIDRNAIIDTWLEGEGWAAENGFAPEMSNYDNSVVKGHSYNVERAKSLMSAAGHANGANFPTLDFYVNSKEGSGAHKMCLAIQKQLKDNININLNIKLCTLEERTQAIASGDAKIWRAGWVADYPAPENFLGLFYGGNVGENTQMNRFNYRSDKFDALFEAASHEEDAEKREKLYQQCDQMVINEAVVMPVLTDDHVVMINARVRNFKASPLESLNLTSVYIKQPLKEEPLN
ncbi:MAG: ABC transporter substrate-binding protein [Crocinitomicaceae bacterium]|nr:ABC transporter substrate-binding protein [Crocinitomicaceae bacterium]